MAGCHHYAAFGLRIVSDILLPELPEAPPQGGGDLSLRFSGSSADSTAQGDTRWLTRIAASTREPWLCCARTAGGYLLRFPGVADLFVDESGRAIECRTAHVPTSDANLHHLVLDHVMPLVLKLREEEALHATAVRTESGVCALIGPSGVGKSTLAAAFLRAGDQVLSDDCLRVIVREERVYAVPAYPGVRLLEDACAVFAEPGEVTTIAGRFSTKRRWTPRRAFESFSAEAAPLAWVYRLERPATSDGAPRIASLSPRDAFMELVASTFRFDALDRRMLAAEFDTWARVARTVPVRRLQLGDDVSGERARACVLADIRR